MLLARASQWFIKKPYWGKALLMGFLISVVALLFICSLQYYVNYEFSELALSADLISFAILAGGIFVFAELVALLSTYFALHRYLSYKTEYYY